MTYEKLRVGHHWRNDWNHPFSNPWNAKIVEILENRKLIVDEWLADDDEINRTEWDEANFRVFYVRLIDEINGLSTKGKGWVKK